jgi:cytochrome c-type biogenesis protein CcmI
LSAWIVIGQGLLALGALAAVAWPFLSKASAEAASRETDELDSLLAQKHLALEAIKELEFDWASGKLSEKDYQAIRRELEAEAIQVIRRLDELSEKPSSQELCPSCQKPVEPDYQFCPTCGAKRP